MGSVTFWRRRPVNGSSQTFYRLRSVSIHIDILYEWMSYYLYKKVSAH